MISLNSIANFYMKLVFLLAFTLGIANISTTNAQCGQALRDEMLQEIGEATYLKDFRVRLDEGNPKKPPAKEFAILLNKGTHYRFNIRDDKDCVDEPILKLYDFTKYYGSSFMDGEHYDKFDFFCAKTQVYYLSISFADAQSGCAAAVVSFVGNYDAN